MENKILLWFLELNRKNKQQLSYIDNQINDLLDLEQQLLKQKMELMNWFILGPEQDEKPSLKTTEQIPTESSKMFLRKQCLERFKQKKHNWQKRTQYNVRKVIADRRLRINGQFLTQVEEDKILYMQKLLGKKIVVTKNHNIKIRSIIKNKFKSKEQILEQLQKLDPDHIQERIQKKRQIFMIK